MLGGTGTPEFERFGYDYPFDKTRALLKQSHIVFGNLEGPLTHADHAPVAKKYVYRSPPEKVAPALRNAGFSVVSLANNHAMDQGVDGLRHTLEALDRVGIQHAGAGMNLAEARRPAILDAGGARVAFLAYTLTFPEEFWATHDRPGSPFGHEAQVRADIVAAKQRADIVLVSFHWGQEGKTELRDYQKRLGRAAIDAGAGAVIGHHPHVLQGVERYRHGVILYSLGNFAFGTYGPEAFRSVVAQLTFVDRQLAEVRLYPLNVRNAEVVFQPTPLRGMEATQVVAEMQRLSQPLGTQLENRGSVAVLVLDPALIVCH
jgi:poly-gamma-glutamate synthesis protein (capsule biosynthesis protein)